MKIGFLIIIAVVIYHFYNNETIKLYYKVKQWERVEAAVVLKNKEINPHSTSVVSPSYIIRVQYDYKYNNIVYRGDKYSFQELLNGKKISKSIRKVDIDRYWNEIKDKMIIYVNKDNPKESVMTCEDIWFYYLIYGLATIALFFGYTFIHLLIVNILELIGILNPFIKR
jgi:Protein of unknown function (DUF3592)